jgi:hypothetical protein
MANYTLKEQQNARSVVKPLLEKQLTPGPFKFAIHVLVQRRLHPSFSPADIDMMTQAGQHMPRKSS